MKYLCLFYQEETEMDELSRSEYDALACEGYDYREELRQSGHLIASFPLQPVRTATSIRVRNGSVSITDGPFAETKEQLGELLVIEARDLNEAIRLASRVPPARLGVVEIRPIHEPPAP